MRGGIENGIKPAEVSGSPGERRESCEKRMRRADARALVIAKEEGPVLPAVAGQLHRPADCGAKLVLLERRRRPCGWIEKVLGIERAVAQEFEDAAVELICAGFKCHVHDRAAGTAELRSEERRVGK